MFSVDFVDNTVIIYVGLQEYTFINPYTLLNFIQTKCFELEYKKSQYIIVYYDYICGEYINSLKDLKAWIDWSYRHAYKCLFCCEILPPELYDFCNSSCRNENSKLYLNCDDEHEFDI